MNLNTIVMTRLQTLFPAQKISEETHLVDDLGADSLDIMELITYVEEEVDRNIPWPPPRLERVRDVISYLEEV